MYWFKYFPLPVGIIRYAIYTIDVIIDFSKIILRIYAVRFIWRPT